MTTDTARDVEKCKDFMGLRKGQGPQPNRQGGWWDHQTNPGLSCLHILHLGNLLTQRIVRRKGMLYESQEIR